MEAALNGILEFSPIALPSATGPVTCVANRLLKPAKKTSKMKRLPAGVDLLLCQCNNYGFSVCVVFRSEARLVMRADKVTELEIITLTEH